MGITRLRVAGVAAVAILAVLAAGASASTFKVTGLVVNATPTNAAPSIHWNRLSGAIAYRVLRDGNRLAQVTATSFIDSTPISSGQHTYRVRGVKADGSLSGFASVDVVYDALPPRDISKAPAGDRLTSGKPTITWTAVSDAGPSGVKQYNIRRDGVYIASVPHGTLTFTDRDAAEGQHSYIVRAQDAAGNKAVDFSPEALVTVDRTAPDAPGGLRAYVTGDSVRLDWNAVADQSGIAGYRVLRNGQLVATTDAIAYTDTPPAAATYGYSVVAVDRAGNASPATGSVQATVAEARHAGDTTGRLALQANLQMWGARIPDAATAVALAKSHDLITAVPGQLAGYIPQMREANPSLKIYGYVNGMFAQRGQGDMFPATWYMRDAAGDKLQSAGWGNYMMDPRGTTPFTHSGVTYNNWTDWVRKQCQQAIVTFGLDGCFLDMLGPAPVNYHPYLVGSKIPVENPVTKAPWTAAGYMALTGSVGLAVQQYTGRAVIGNSLEFGAHFYATPTRALLPATQLTLAEMWMRNPQQPADKWPTVDRWKQDVQMIVDCNDGGHPVEVTMKLWVDSTAAQRQAWRAFGQASFLIGNSGSAWFEYTSSRSTLSWNDTSPLDDVDLGAALDTHSSVDGYLRDGVYQRRFQRGIALVNPGTAAVIVHLDRSYRTSGGSLVTQVTLAPHSGQVLQTA
ncbi:MAG TPA: putative glycoside hydrolase [Gaiellales bacterium]|nr:putative glycoside hydrolase [Gaiellales bacterium]